jgi:hypothetical protein
MGPKKLFKKLGRNIQAGGGQLVRGAGKAAGGVLGAAAGKAILSGLATYAPEVAEGAVIALKTGGRVPGGRNKPVNFVGHGSEYILPANAKPTKAQKAIVAKNRAKAKGCSCHKFV